LISSGVDNGFSVTVKKVHCDSRVIPLVQQFLDDEKERGLDNLIPYHKFAERVERSYGRNWVMGESD